MGKQQEDVKSAHKLSHQIKRRKSALTQKQQTLVWFLIRDTSILALARTEHKVNISQVH